jgi:O-acetyl-ADP-ribose deacetylase (regulator of RNase III)
MNLVQGNLIDMAKNGDFDIIIHGCNCFTTMGAGIAASIAREFPDAYTADQETVKGDPGKLGTYTIGMHGKLVIINAYTQFGMSRGNDDVFEYLAFERVLEKLTQRFGKYKFGLPMIGMGLAGGDPNRIIPIIEKFSEMVNRKSGSVTLVEFKS